MDIWWYSKKLWRIKLLSIIDSIILQSWPFCAVDAIVVGNLASEEGQFKAIFHPRPSICGSLTEKSSDIWTIEADSNWISCRVLSAGLISGTKSMPFICLEKTVRCHLIALPFYHRGTFSSYKKYRCWTIYCQSLVSKSGGYKVRLNPLIPVAVRFRFWTTLKYILISRIQFHSTNSKDYLLAFTVFIDCCKIFRLAIGTREKLVNYG